jgi:hypothetical protein
MFLAWAILRNLEGEMHREESTDSLANVRARRMTGREFLFKECDGKFWEEDLNDEGNAFAKEYYEALYVGDYENALGGDLASLYQVEDTWKNFDKIAPLLDSRLEAWRKRHTGQKTTCPKRNEETQQDEMTDEPI